MIFNDTSTPVQTDESKKAESVSKKSVEKDPDKEISAPKFKMPVVKKSDIKSHLSDKKSLESTISKDSKDSKSDEVRTKTSDADLSQSTKSKKKKGRVKRAKF